MKLIEHIKELKKEIKDLKRELRDYKAITKITLDKVQSQLQKENK